jgi:hypothetical protein
MSWAGSTVLPALSSAPVWVDTHTHTHTPSLPPSPFLLRPSLTLFAVLTTHSQRRQVCHQPPSDWGSALPSTATLPKGQAKDQCVCPWLHSWSISFCRERHFQPLSHPAGPRQHIRSWEKTFKSQCFQKEVCEEKVKCKPLQAKWPACSCEDAAVSSYSFAVCRASDGNFTALLMTCCVMLDFGETGPSLGLWTSTEPGLPLCEGIWWNNSAQSRF